MKMIVGLGNPGKKYDGTRHNVGFMAIDALADAWGLVVDKKEKNALTGRGVHNGEKVLLVKPQTFMNLSGDAVWQLIDYYADQLDDFLIIYDDMDLPVAQVRFKRRGSSGGHNGIKSIIQCINSKEFDRLKIGIGKKDNVIGHVLSPFSKQERAAIDEALITLVQACDLWLDVGIDRAMNEYN